MGSDSGGGGTGDMSPNNWSGGRQWDSPPKFVVFVSTLNIEEYSSTPA